MFKRTLALLLSASLIIFTASCTKAATSYSEESVPVYFADMTGDKKATVRMYGDIPYIKIDDYYNELFFTGADAYPNEASPMKVEHHGSVYDTYSYNGIKASFDVDAETFECENFDSYSTPPYYALLLNSERDPSAPFVRVLRTDYSGDLKAVKVDFAQYGIDIVGDKDDLWVPVPVLSCLFCSPFAYNVYFNGKGLYLEDGMQQLQEVNAKDQDDGYYDFTQNERSKEKAKFDYGVICFYVDTCYGYPERSRLSTSIAEVGLDKTLDTTIDGMKLTGIKEKLMSSDIKDYAAGLYCLSIALDDGGHTGFPDFMWMSQEDLSAISKAMGEMGIAPTEKTSVAEVSGQSIIDAYTGAGDSFDLMEKVMYDDGEQALYFEKGDTAMYLFDHFYCNRAAWTAYEDGSLSEMPEDSMGTFMKALDKAKSNPKIKNFVVNLAVNSGGESGIATTMSKIISGQAYRHQYDSYTGQDEVIYYDVDLNFDGVFDEKDDEVSYPFRFAVITGAITYSAANYLANMARDNGVVVLGEQAGGGACSPQRTPFPEGFAFHLSGRYTLRDKNNEHVDFGVEPDYVLTQEKDGEVDYSQFADLELISRYMDEFYKK